ncbi:MAG TPA: FAD-linked oxidase C-terminal domain-containing protein [Methylomirabilota bacterium]|nr:FAD-linked oxidase C-terminal domain-containing protein [Methylomirabilota bacterium]
MDSILISRLRAIVGPEGIVEKSTSLSVYDCDGYTLERSTPEVVVLPRSTEEVSAVVKLLHKEEIAFVPRGAGTGLSGGCLPVEAPVMIGTSRMNRIVQLDVLNRYVVAEAGVVNLWVSNAVKNRGWQYAPDPSSQQACTIGGNIAENSGGPHTLKYGVTTNHVLGVEIVLPDGDVVTFGGAVEDVPGYDLRGITIGAEGTFGIVTKATLRLTRQPQAYRTFLAVYESVHAATQTVSDIIAAGIVPAALEMMDSLIIQAVEVAFHFGFPTDAGAVLIIELDGLEAGLDSQTAKIMAICQRNNAREVRIARDDAERLALWKSRKRAFGAVGRLAPNYCTQDGVVPRTKVPDILRVITSVAEKYQLRIANVFHAGDGNIHPILLYDERNKNETERVIKAGQEILQACVELGGSLTGEHGIGVEKMGQMPLIFSPEDLLTMTQIRSVFNPDHRCNPHKIIPTPRGCIDVRMPKRQAAL